MLGLFRLFMLVKNDLLNAINKLFLNDIELTYNEVKLIIENTLDGKGISYTEFKNRQLMLKNANVSDERAKKLIDDFQTKNYHHYLHNIRKKRSFNIPFIKDHIPSNTPLNRRPGYSMDPIYLTIHSTANPGSTARGERKNLAGQGNPSDASFHLVVDEKEAVECIPLNEAAWHAGDGRNGTGNRKTIGLEICESGDRTKTLKNAISLSAKLLRDRGWSVSKLKRHYDWSGKDCPRILILSSQRKEPYQTWEWFKQEVDKRLC